MLMYWQNNFGSISSITRVLARTNLKHLENEILSDSASLSFSSPFISSKMRYDDIFQQDDPMLKRVRNEMTLLIFRFLKKNLQSSDEAKSRTALLLKYLHIFYIWIWFLWLFAHILYLNMISLIIRTYFIFKYDFYDYLHIFLWLFAHIHLNLISSHIVQVGGGPSHKSQYTRPCLSNVE